MNTHTKQFLITIDDAPSLENSNMFEILDQFNIRAIFFCIGEKIVQNPQYVRDAINRGHIIANHSYYHKHASKTPLHELQKELISTQQLIDNLYKETEYPYPARLFRFPYGDKGTHFPLSFITLARFFSIKYIRLQHFLKNNSFKGIDVNHSFHPDFKFNLLRKDYDWFWTCDFKEWSQNWDDIKTQADKICLRNMNEILLLHDHKTTHEKVLKLLQLIVNKNCTFMDPKNIIL
jgi:peptidoglycan/xylan/chitin deacetylase (PgdA/CDA1 family)